MLPSDLFGPKLRDLAGAYVKWITMNPDPLDELLSSYAKHPVPTRANATRADIWSAIEDRKKRSTWRRWLSFADVTELVGRPSLALSALAFAALVGIVPAAVAGRAANETRMARQSIHLEAFSAKANGIAMVLSRPGSD